MILVANKVDLMHLRKITREQGKEMATKHNVGCVCVCVGGTRKWIRVSTPSLPRSWLWEWNLDLLGSRLDSTERLSRHMQCGVFCETRQQTRERAPSGQSLEALMWGAGTFTVDRQLWCTGYLLTPDTGDSSLGCAEDWLLSPSLSQLPDYVQNHQMSCRSLSPAPCQVLCWGSTPHKHTLK